MDKRQVIRNNGRKIIEELPGHVHRQLVEPVEVQKLAVLNQQEDDDLVHGCKAALTGEHDAILIFVQTLDEMVRYTRQTIKEQ